MTRFHLRLEVAALQGQLAALTQQHADDDISVMFAPSTGAMVTSPPGQ